MVGKVSSPYKICDSSRAPWLLHNVGLDDVLLVSISLNSHQALNQIINNIIQVFENRNPDLNLLRPGARTNVGRPGLCTLGPSQTFLCDNDVIDGSDKEDGASPKYSLSRTVTAGESSMRNFLMPGV